MTATPTRTSAPLVLGIEDARRSAIRGAAPASISVSMSTTIHNAAGSIGVQVNPVPIHSRGQPAPTRPDAPVDPRYTKRRLYLPTAAEMAHMKASNVPVLLTQALKPVDSVAPAHRVPSDDVSVVTLEGLNKLMIEKRASLERVHLHLRGGEVMHCAVWGHSLDRAHSDAADAPVAPASPPRIAASAAVAQPMSPAV